MSVRRPLLWFLVVGAIFTAMPVGAGEPRTAQVSPEPPAPRLTRGVVVVASRDAPIDATWKLAQQVYANKRLCPRGLHDATARALAGERPNAGAGPRTQELFSLRASLSSEGPSTRRLLASVASEIGVSGVVLVFQNASHQPRARLFVVKRGDFATPVLWSQPDASGQPSWSKSVAWLASLTGAPQRDSDPSNGTNIFTSPWFWGALTAVAGVVVVGIVAARDDDPETIHLQGKVSR